MIYIGIGIGIFALLGFIVYRISKWLKKLKHDEEESRLSIQKREDLIRAMSMSEAKQRALLVMAEPNKFSITRQPLETATWTESFAPSIREFLLEFETVLANNGRSIRRNEIYFYPSLTDPRFIKIGWDFDDVEVYVKPLKEGIYLMDADDLEDALAAAEEEVKNSASDWPDYPSIYHWIFDKGTDFDD